MERDLKEFWDTYGDEYEREQGWDSINKRWMDEPKTLEQMIEQEKTRVNKNRNMPTGVNKELFNKIEKSVKKLEGTTDKLERDGYEYLEEL